MNKQELNTQINKMRRAMCAVKQTPSIPESNKEMIVTSIEMKIHNLNETFADDSFATEQYRDIELNEIIVSFEAHIKDIIRKWGKLIYQFPETTLEMKRIQKNIKDSDNRHYTKRAAKRGIKTFAGMSRGLDEK